MSITTNMGMMGGSAISPQERQMRNERKRVQSYIKSYNRDPKQWSNSMIQQLEQLSLQYQIPFKRQVQEAGALRQAGAALGGIADSAAFGFIPDKWYSSEATRKGANVGKIGGAAAQIAAAIALTAATKGAAAPTIAKAAGNFGSALKAIRGIGTAGTALKEGAKLGANVASKGLVGRSASGALKMGRETLAPYGSQQGWSWAKGAMNEKGFKASEEIFKAASNAVDKTGDLAKIVKGKNLTPGQITMLTNQITTKYGPKSKVAKNFLEQLKSSKSVGSLQGVETKHIIDMANGLNKNWNVNLANIKKLLTKSKADASNSNASYILGKLEEANITKLDDDALKELLKLVKSGADATGKLGLADIDKWGALGTLGMGAGAGMSLMDYTPSREELEQQEDPYDPYNL